MLWRALISMLSDLWNQHIGEGALSMPTMPVAARPSQRPGFDIPLPPSAFRGINLFVMNAHPGRHATIGRVD